MPWQDSGFGDGVVISEAAAKNLTSEHIYDLSKPLDVRMALSSGRFTTYGKKYKIDAENWAQLDRETGIINPGSVVKKGDRPRGTDTSYYRFEFSRIIFRSSFGILEFRYTK